MLLDSLNHAQRERLAFIDFNLEFLGQIARAELIQKFGIGPASCTRDFAVYKELAPGNAVLMHENKRYVRSEAFRAVFEHNPVDAIKALAKGSSGEISKVRDASQFCFDTVQLCQPTTEVISAITRAIFSKSVVACHYESLSNGTIKRQILPHAVFYSGHRWYVRSYDMTTNEFKDFVSTRFKRIELITSEVSFSEVTERDIDWNTYCELHIVAHPRLANRKAIEMEYGMKNGVLNVRIRRALMSVLVNSSRTLFLKNFHTLLVTDRY
jgi:predicted DNA-binding transcriptional regulator YafY